MGIDMGLRALILIYFVISGHLNLSIGEDGFVLKNEDVDFKNQFSMMEKIKLKTKINLNWTDKTNFVFWILSTIYPKSLCGLVE